MKKTNKLFPWHEKAWEMWVSALREKRLPSALILSGAPGLGKAWLAELLARSAHCKDPLPDGVPCQQCVACRQYTAGSHPDHLRLQPAEEGGSILIEQVRAFTDRLFLTSQEGNYRTGLVMPAEAMNENAFDSFLKTLEEPPESAVLILVTNRLHVLPATIQSRCRIMQIPHPSRAVGLAWLQERELDADARILDQAGGAPLRALHFYRSGHADRTREWADGMCALMNDQASPIKQAEAWQAEFAEEFLYWLLHWLMDLYKAKLGAPQTRFSCASHVEELLRAADRLSWSQMRELHGKTVETIRRSTSQAQPRLLLESLLISWAGKTTGE